MPTATIDSRGRVTLPKEVREHLGVRKGDKVELWIEGGEVRLRRVEAPPAQAHSILELRGLGKELWEGIDPVEYVRAERDSWES